MNFQTRLIVLLGVAMVVGAALFARGDLDLFVTSWFYDGYDFDWRESGLANFFHNLVHPAALTCWGLLSLAVVVAYRRGQSVRLPLFLLVALTLGPGVITNTILKDHWDRARPLQVREFGGDKTFTPPLLMSNQCVRNCSFVAGDPAMGFWFHSFAYVVPPRRRRQVFVAGIGLGFGYGLLRIGMGAHFLSDVFFAGVVVLLTSAAMCRVVLGRVRLREVWRDVLGGQAGAAAPLMQRQLP